MSIPEITHIVSLLEGGKVAQARPMLEQLLSEVPEHISARVVLARLLESQSDHRSALHQWKWAAYYCPNNAVIENGLRKAVMHELFSGAFEPAAPPEAESSFERAPEWPEADAAPDHVAELPVEVVSPKQPQASEHPLPAGAPVLEYQDLDRLIQELESARIVPDPDVKMIPHGELETEIDDVVSETLARIYANQKFHEEAAVVYEKLATQRPDKAEEFLQKAQELRQKHVAKDR